VAYWDDSDFALRLLENTGLATVPGSAFYAPGHAVRQFWTAIIFIGFCAFFALFHHFREQGQDFGLIDAFAAKAPTVCLTDIWILLHDL